MLIEKRNPVPYEIPISILDWQSNAGSYKDTPVNTASVQNGEPLVKVADYGIASQSYYARTDGQNTPYSVRIEGSLEFVWARRGIAEKLQQVNRRLKSYGVELFVFDAYRPMETQKGLWLFFERAARHEMPNASAEEIRNYILQFVSDPMSFVRDSSRTWPVHTTGGAVDVSLCGLDDGVLLDMGVGFDEMSVDTFSDSLERAYISNDVPHDHFPLLNRRLLHWAMKEEGFVNYPLEFWHFDWGTQMYVYNRNAMGQTDIDTAWYGYIEPPLQTA